MKKRTLNTKLSLKKVTIVALGSSREGQVFGGTGADLCIPTLDCPTARLCPTNDCPIDSAECGSLPLRCQTVSPACQDTRLCPAPTTLKNCPSFALC